MQLNNGSATVSVASSRPTRKRLPNNLFCSLAGWPRRQTTHFSVNLLRRPNAFGETPKAAGEDARAPQSNCTVPD
jgi:hypothetical protein